MKRMLIVCTTDSMIWNFLVPHIQKLEKEGYYIECACSKTGDFFDKLINLYDLKMNKIQFERSPYKFQNILAYKQLVALIKNKNFDTVFCHEPVGGAIGRLVGHKFNCKVIYMAHGFHFFKGAPKTRKLYYLVEKYLSRYTDVLITINQEDYLASKKFHAKKCFKTNGIGVDTKKFAMDNNEKNYIKKEMCLPEDAIVILSVGELIQRKNHAVIIKALSKLNQSNLYYLIAGEGEIRVELESLIRNLGLEKNIHLLGYRTDINKLCNSADIFALPSVHEGLSVALMEAMGCGKPVIGAKIRGNVDLIDEGKGGFLVDTFNIDDYSNKINYLLCNEELRNSMGLYNINKVKEFDIDTVKKQLFEIIEEE